MFSCVYVASALTLVSKTRLSRANNKLKGGGSCRDELGGGTKRQEEGEVKMSI